jgi:translation initiation factor 2 alpha subunit (eIF-2alpha)
MPGYYFYPERVPPVDTVVIADVKTIRDDAVYCSLPAYGDMEVMLPTSEINVKRHKRVTDYLRVGQQIAVNVMRDEGKNMDVSLKQVRESEAKEAMDQFHRDARVNLVVRSATGQDPAATEALYRDVVWPLVSEAMDDERVVDAYEFLEELRAADEVVVEGEPSETSITRVVVALRLPIPPALMEAVRARIPMPSHTVEKEVMIRQGVYHDGAARVADILDALASTEGIQVVVVAPPKYRVTATDRTKVLAAARLDAAIADMPELC